LHWLFWRWGSHELFALGWPQTMILLISASQVAGITGVSHRCPAYCFFLAELLAPILPAACGLNDSLCHQL
jgi:hypothetical protein